MSSALPSRVPRRHIGPKIAATATNVMPADRNAISESELMCQADPANTSAMNVGKADWNTIAPVMLPIASVSFPWRTQIRELNFSGSSVAIGAMTSASSSSLTPSVVARCSTASTNSQAPPTMQASATMTWRLTMRSRGTAGSSRWAARSIRWKRSGARSSWCSSASSAKWPFTYQA